MPADPYLRAQEAQRLARCRRRRNQRDAVRRTARQTTPDDERSTAGSPMQQQGRAAETLAARYLSARGLSILARNLHCRTGEIDLAARQGHILVFIEVRQRHSRRYGGAAASVNRAKQTRLIRAARYFLPALSHLYFEGHPPPCRFDVIGIEGVQIDWIKDAFQMK